MSQNPDDSGTFMIIWVGFMVLMIVGISLVFLWGVRSRQFENQDRARHLPLWSGIPDDSEDDGDDDNVLGPIKKDPPKGEDNSRDAEP